MNTKYGPFYVSAKSGPVNVTFTVKIVLKVAFLAPNPLLHTQFIIFSPLGMPDTHSDRHFWINEHVKTNLGTGSTGAYRCDASKAGCCGGTPFWTMSQHSMSL